MRLHPCSITFLFNKPVTSTLFLTRSSALKGDTKGAVLPSKSPPPGAVQALQLNPMYQAPMQPRLPSNPRPSCLGLLSAVIKQGKASVPGFNHLLKQIKMCVKEWTKASNGILFPVWAAVQRKAFHKPEHKILALLRWGLATFYRHSRSKTSYSATQIAEESVFTNNRISLEKQSYHQA